MTKQETQAVKEVLLWMLLKGGNVVELYTKKKELGVLGISFSDRGWITSTGPGYTITPKGIALVEQGE